MDKRPGDRSFLFAMFLVAPRLVSRVLPAFFWLGVPVLLAALPVQAAESAAGSSAGGVVSGRVRYTPDPARPWPLGRYYLNSGSLTETVVALEGAGLTAPLPPARTVWVDQKNFNFIPETVAIHAGDSVRFTNSDEALHNVMTFQGPEPFNVNLPQGKEYVHLFAAGKGLQQQILLTCVFHAAMRGWVFVFDHPFYVVTSRDGKFRFEHVPPGEYQLHVVHPAGELEWSQKVTVKSDAPVEIEIALSPNQKKK
jgi:plastocyanin